MLRHKVSLKVSGYLKKNAECFEESPDQQDGMLAHWVPHVDFSSQSSILKENHLT